MKRARKGGEMSPNRRAINACSLMFTFVALFCSMHFSSGEHTSGIHKMGNDLRNAILEALGDVNVNYTEFNATAVYESSTAFNPKGMAVLYNITNIFINWVVPDEFPEDIVIMQNGIPQLKYKDYKGVPTHYIQLILLGLSLVLFALLMPVCGFFFCCCRCCCGNCGARPKPFDKGKDLCKKCMFGSILIIFETLLIFGVVCAFVTNEHMQEGTEELTTNYRTSVKDVNTYFTKTSAHIDTLLDVNFKEFDEVLINTLSNSSMIIYNQMKQISKATSMDEALFMVTRLQQVKDTMDKMKTHTRTLRVEASKLNDAMRKVKRDLLDILRKCKNIPECAELEKNYVNNLKTEIDFNSIPDITDEISKLTDFLDKDISTNIERGIQNLQNIPAKINDEIRSTLEKVKEAIGRAGKTINEKSSNALTSANRTLDVLNRNSHTYLKQADRYIKEYSKYRYYIDLGASCTLLLISICIAIGLICGVCGKRPDSYNDDCCNKGLGSKCLIIGVGIMFLSAAILVAILLVHMVGMFAQLLVCEPIRHPESDKLKYLDYYMDFKSAGMNVTLSSMLANCYRNESAYVVFNLKNQIDLDEINGYMEKFNIDEMLLEVEEAIKQVNIKEITLLKEEDYRTLENLRTSEIDDIDFDKFKEELSINFTNVNLETFSEQLASLIKLLRSKPAFEEVVQSLELTKLHIDAYIDKLFKPMVNHAQEVIEAAKDTKEQLKFGKDSFEEAIGSLIDNIKTAQNVLTDHEGIDLLINVTKSFSFAIQTQIETYLKRVVYNVRDNVGECGPLALAINGTVTATCDKILAPVNGFWFSILWCLILFLPTIIVSEKLASLYQKREMHGSYIEAEYLYDAYADRENIPLARGKHGKKKHKKMRGDNSRGYRSETLELGRDYPGGSHNPDRYADMAPKHFEDFPNGGPPQYQRATEYERPPPYYYAGSGEQH